MMRTPWSKAHHLNLPLMDEDHELLAAFLVEAQSADDANFITALKDLREAMAAHFYHEERLMIALSYPQAHMHIKEHASVMQIMDLAIETARLDTFVAIRLFLIDALDSWFQNHLTKSDAPVANWFNEAFSQLSPAGEDRGEKSGFSAPAPPTLSH
jgi:hemerythrin-like metal-binding protein